MAQDQSNRPGVVGNVNEPGHSATPEERPDTDAPPWSVEPITSVPQVNRSKKPTPNLPTLMQTPSMTSPAATRPRKGTHRPMDGAEAPISD
jgi:hypothetical protein